jgi:hypothetical protein
VAAGGANLGMQLAVQAAKESTSISAISTLNVSEQSSQSNTIE